MGSERRNTCQGFREENEKNDYKSQKAPSSQKNLEEKSVKNCNSKNELSLKGNRSYSIDKAHLNKGTHHNAKNPLLELNSNLNTTNLDKYKDLTRANNFYDQNHRKPLSYWESYTEKGKEEHEILLARLKSFRRKFEDFDEEDNKIIYQHTHDNDFHERGLKTEIDVLDQEISELQVCIRRQLATNEDIDL